MENKELKSDLEMFKMTNLKDKIYDVCVDYINETREGAPDDAEVFAESVMEEIREYFTNILE